MKPGDFEIIDEGTEYQLPTFKVVKGKGLEHCGQVWIEFVRGSKRSEEEVKPVTGITHESLLEMVIHDLKYKNGLVPSRESALAITKLEEALSWLKRRQEIREKEGTQGTYQK